MRDVVGAPDVAIARVAARQHGVVAAWQLAALGLTREFSRHRVARGRWRVLHRGVYLVGVNETALTRYAAAVIACGRSAALSHRSAASLHGFAPPPELVEVTVIAGQPRTRRGIRVRRRPLGEDEVTEVEGIRVTTPERTIRDLAATTSRRELERAIEEAQIQRKLDRLALADAVGRAAGRRGARALRAAAKTEPGITRSEAERLLRRLVEAAGLPRAVTNVRLGRYEVDALWRAERLVVEVDGFATHGTRQAFERDRRRDADLTAAGYRVLRFTWWQLLDEPHLVVARLAAALSRERAGPP